MRPTLRQLEYLVAIAETGSFSEAARRTFVSQPSLSSQVKDMEGFLGAALFERGRQGALLTPIGQQLVVRARLILRDVEALKTLAREAGSTLSGMIKLGVLPSVGPYLLPQAVRQFHADYPELRISVREERTLDLHRHLADGRFDIIISTMDESEDMEYLPIARENLYICAAPDDELAADKGAVSIAQIKGRALLSLGFGHKLSAIVNGLAEIAGASVSTEYEGTSLDAIRQMAAMGGNVAILPSLYAISEAKKDPDLIVRRIDHPLAGRQIGLLWRKASPLADSFRKIGQVFETVAQDIMSEADKKTRAGKA